MMPVDQPVHAPAPRHALAVAAFLGLVAIAAGRVLALYPPPVLWLLDVTVGRDDSLNVVIVLKIVEALLIGLCCVGTVHLCRWTSIDILGGSNRGWAFGAQVLIGIGVALLALGVTAFATISLAWWNGEAPPGPAAPRDHAIVAVAEQSAGRLAIALAFAAIGEELLFRGLLFRIGTAHGLGRGVVVLVISLIFVAWHWPLTSMVEVTMLFVLSCLFGAARVTGGLLAAILAHGLYNSKALLLA